MYCSGAAALEGNTAGFQVMSCSHTRVYVPIQNAASKLSIEINAGFKTVVGAQQSERPRNGK